MTVLRQPGYFLLAMTIGLATTWLALTPFEILSPGPAQAAGPEIEIPVAAQPPPPQLCTPLACE